MCLPISLCTISSGFSQTQTKMPGIKDLEEDDRKISPHRGDVEG